MHSQHILRRYKRRSHMGIGNEFSSLPVVDIAWCFSTKREIQREHPRRIPLRFPNLQLHSWTCYPYIFKEDSLERTPKCEYELKAPSCIRFLHSNGIASRSNQQKRHVFRAAGKFRDAICAPGFFSCSLGRCPNGMDRGVLNGLGRSHQCNRTDILWLCL